MTPERFAKLQSALRRRQPDLTVFMDAVNKTHNISAIIRTADAVGIHSLHTLSTGRHMHRHHMIAGGARHYVGLTLHASTGAAIDALHAEGWTLIAAHASPRAVDYRDVDYTAKVAIVAGAELIGVSEAALAAAAQHVAIPMHGLGTSLNVSVAVGVLLLEAERQRRAAGLYDASRLPRAEYEHTLFEWCYPEIAARCRQLGRPYPALTADGMMASNPLLDVSA